MINKKVYDNFSKETVVELLVNNLEENKKLKKENDFLYKNFESLAKELVHNKKINKKKGIENKVDIDYILDKLGW